MTLAHFLLHKTRAEELCVICDPWRVATAWIDHEDLFIKYIHPDLMKKEVLGDEWKTLRTTNEVGYGINIRAHYIYI